MPTTELVFELRGGNKQAWDCTDPEVFVEGARGTGKSRTLLEKEYYYAQLVPGLRSLIVRKTLKSIAGSVAQTMNQYVKQNGDGMSFFGGNEIEPAAYKFRNGSAIVLGGLDDMEKLKSSEYSRIYFNEATEGTEDDWEALKALLRQVIPGVTLKRQITGDCNPTDAGNWVNQYCEQGRATRIKTYLQDNPLYYTADGVMTEEGERYINGVLETYRGSRRARWLEGLWTGVENAVYPMFDRAVHIRPIDPGIYFNRTLLWLDYGSMHKCSVGALSIDQFNRRWVRECWGQPDTDEGKTLDLVLGQFRERYHTTIGRGDPNQRYLNEKAFRNRPDKETRLGGPNGRAGNGARQIRIDWAEQLFYSYPGGRVPTMKQSTRLAFQQGPFAEPDSPGIFLVEGAPGIEEFANELESYHYVIKETDRGKFKEVYRMEEDHIAGFEYANELWEELTGAAPPLSSIPNPLTKSKPELEQNPWVPHRRRHERGSGEFKLH